MSIRTPPIRYGLLTALLCTSVWLGGCTQTPSNAHTTEGFWLTDTQYAMFASAETQPDAEDSMLSPTNTTGTADTDDSDTQASISTLSRSAEREEATAVFAQTSTVPSPEEYVSSVIQKERQHQRYQLHVPYLSQYPELPTGCEVTSLTMLLNYLGSSIDKTTLVDDYLVYGESFVVSYLGNPYEDGAGIYPPGIVLTVERFASQNNAELTAVDLTGTSLDDLLKLIENGYPVMIWATLRMEYPSFDEGVYEEYDGIYYPWYLNEHCILLTGYNTKDSTVSISDPIYGEYTCDMDYFEQIYNEIGQFSLTVIQQTN